MDSIRRGANYHVKNVQQVLFVRSLQHPLNNALKVTTAWPERSNATFVRPALSVLRLQVFQKYVNQDLTRQLVLLPATSALKAWHVRALT